MIFYFLIYDVGKLEILSNLFKVIYREVEFVWVWVIDFGWVFLLMLEC